MTKLELARRIAQDLADDELLNAADSTDYERLLDAVSDTILNRLEDYTILQTVEILK
jgi:hypothetical protein